VVLSAERADVVQFVPTLVVHLSTMLQLVRKQMPLPLESRSVRLAGVVLLLEANESLLPPLVFPLLKREAMKAVGHFKNDRQANEEGDTQTKGHPEKGFLAF
jgi:hypothetical protein